MRKAEGWSPGLGEAWAQVVWWGSRVHGREGDAPRVSGLPIGYPKILTLKVWGPAGRVSARLFIHYLVY